MNTYKVVQPPKTRIVTIRMSNEEYEAIRSVTVERGYRNVSELARAAIHALIISTSPADDLLAHRLQERESILATLMRELDRLHRLADGRSTSPEGLNSHVKQDDSQRH